MRLFPCTDLTPAQAAVLDEANQLVTAFGINVAEPLLIEPAQKPRFACAIPLAVLNAGPHATALVIVIAYARLTARLNAPVDAPEISDMEALMAFADNASKVSVGSTDD